MSKASAARSRKPALSSSSPSTSQDDLAFTTKLTTYVAADEAVLKSVKPAPAAKLAGKNPPHRTPPLRPKRRRRAKKQQELDSNQKPTVKPRPASTEAELIDLETDDIFEGYTKSNVLFEWPLRCALRLVNLRLRSLASREADLTPFMFFCKVQLRLWLLTIKCYLEKRTLIYLDLEEMFVSLLELLHKAESWYPTESHYLARHLERLGYDLSWCAAFLARLSHAQSFDFMRVIEALDINRAEGVPSWNSIPLMREYAVHNIISKGDFCCVFRVTHQKTNLQCAMSIEPLSGEADAVLIAGAVLTMIDHPCIVLPLACYRAGGSMITLSEYFRATSLESIVMQSPFISIDVFRIICAQAVAAVTHLHECGVLHGALLISNLLLDIGGRLRVVGFHHARICLAHPSNRSQLNFHDRRTAEFAPDLVSALPVRHMAPEIVARQPFGRTSDWWTLGVTLYQVLMQCFPFDGQDEAEIQNKILKSEVPYPDRDGVPVTAAAILFLNALLAKNPSLRCLIGDCWDIQRHSFFVGIDWHKLKSSEKLFAPLAGFSHAMQVHIPQRFQREDLTEAELKALHPQVMEKELQDPSVTHPRDLPLQQVANESFMAPRFLKALLTRERSRDVKNKVFFRPISYHAESVALAIGDTMDLDVFRAERLQVPLIRKSKFDLGMSLSSTRAENGSLYYYITGFSSNFHHGRVPLVEGDFVLALAGESLVDATMAFVKARLTFAFALETVVTVQSSSPFRLAASHPEFGMLVTSMRKVKVDLPKPSTCKTLLEPFVQTTDILTKVIGYFTGWVMDAAHIIWRISTSFKNLFVGDIIVAVDGTSSLHFSSQQLNALLRGGAKSVSIIPTSSLRKNRIVFDRLLRAFEGNNEILDKRRWPKIQKAVEFLSSEELQSLSPLHKRYLDKRMKLSRRPSHPFEAEREPLHQ